MTYSGVQKAAAEFLGTGLLVATVVGSGIMAETLAGGNIGLALLANTIATGAILFVLITVLGPVSGAHFNPVVSAIFVLRRELPALAFAGFALAQISGGIGGTMLAHAMFEQDLLQFSQRIRTGPTQWLSEAVATFSLVFAIIGTLRARPAAVPIVVALVIVAAYWFTASTSFANPAVTIARALSDTFSGIAPANAAQFIAAQFAGGVAAWLMAERVFNWRAMPGEEPSL